MSVNAQAGLAVSLTCPRSLGAAKTASGWIVAAAGDHRHLGGGGGSRQGADARCQTQCSMRFRENREIVKNQRGRYTDRLPDKHKIRKVE